MDTRGIRAKQELPADRLAFVADGGAARLALSPLRQDLLRRLRKAGSAATLSEETGLARQRIGYHLKLLEQAGLIRPAGSRQRRGFTEQLYEAKGDALLVDPMILAPADPEAVDKQDAFAAEHLVRTAAMIVRDVSRMREAAGEEGSRLLTFTVEAEVAFAAPSEIERFTARLAVAIADLAADFAPAKGEGRTYRLVAGGHPAVNTKTGRAGRKSLN